MHRNPLSIDRRRLPWCAAAFSAWCAVSGFAGAAAPGTPPGPAGRAPAVTRPRPIVDHEVVPAGGVACRHCGHRDCPLHRGHLDACRDGLCAPHCPVRPVEYGFYRTQWRRWPGQGVEPVSAEQAATPVPPPASLVPSADEESPLAPEDGGATPPSEPDAGSGDVEAGKSPDPDEPVRARPPASPLPSEPVPETVDPPVPPPESGSGPGTPAPAPAEPEPTSPERPSTPPADGLFDQTGVPRPAPEGLRYPAEVGRSLAAGASPWRLQPPGRQRPADSARGL